MTESQQLKLQQIEMNIGGVGISCFDFPTSMTPYGTKEVILGNKLLISAPIVAPK